MANSKSSLYSSAQEYIDATEGMKNEVNMWYIASALLIQEAVRKVTQHKYGALIDKCSIDLMQSIPPFSVLDVCCGPGNLANYLGLMHPKLDLIGIDLDEEFIKEARRKFSNTAWRFIVANAITFRSKKKFDVVVASSAYHHIRDEEKQEFVDNLEHNLNEDGKIIVCENFLPGYDSDKDRKSAVIKYYEALKKYYSSENSSKSTFKAIDEVRYLELANTIEHKVDFDRFKRHLRHSRLEIEVDIPVWQPKQFSKDNAGSHVLLLRRN